MSRNGRGGRQHAPLPSCRPTLSCSPLDLPGGEAPDVDVEPVEVRVGVVSPELNLELHLVSSHGQVTHGTRNAGAWTSPRAVRWAVREFSVSNDCAGYFAEGRFVHLAEPRHRRKGAIDRPGRKARCHSSRRHWRQPGGSRWKAAYLTTILARVPPCAELQPAFRARAATWMKAQNASGWTAHARKAAAMASRSSRDAKPSSTARAPIGDVRSRSA